MHNNSTDTRNLIIAIVLCLVILFAWEVFFVPVIDPPAPATTPATTRAENQNQTQDSQQPTPQLVQPDQIQPDQIQPSNPSVPSRATAARIQIETPKLSGSISLRGAQLDDIVLTQYRVAVEDDADPVRLLSPGQPGSRYAASSGWTSQNGTVAVPDDNTLWTVVSGNTLTPQTPVTLNWDNGNGLLFARTLEVDANYLVRITDTVTATRPIAAVLAPYALVGRNGFVPQSALFILHVGPIGAFNDRLVEIDYDDVLDQGAISEQTNGGWIGFSDKYWLVALLFPNGQEAKTRFFGQAGPSDYYQVDATTTWQALQNQGDTISATHHLFIGAKEVDQLDAYREQFQLPLFDRAVDFGWFYFLTKPFFHAVNFIYLQIGNFGFAILIFTVVLKLLVFPLAIKSYTSIARTRQVQPEIDALRKVHGDDRQVMQKEMMALYKKHNINPLSGCVPILIQIPVFFALYKVLLVTIEMRHAPFFGWIADLSAPDPVRILNAFGLIPWDVPPVLALINLGVWPIIMGLTLWLQQRLNPKPSDPIQQKIFAWMPIFFTFLLGNFPAGLVIYWSWNNLLTIGQQLLINSHIARKGRKTQKAAQSP